MRKSKVMKALIALGMSITTATSIAAISACTHEHESDGSWQTDKNQHWHEATCSDHPGEKFDIADHVDADDNGKCDICEYVMYTPAAETWTVTLKNTGDEDKTVQVEKGQKLTAAQIPTLEDTATHTFEGWYNGADKLTTDTVISGNVTYTAKWTEKQQQTDPVKEYWTVTLKNTGDEDKTVQVEKGQKLTAEQIPALNDTATHTFEGWYNGTDKLTTDTVISGNVTYTAKWTEKPVTPPAPATQYTVTLKYENGSDDASLIVDENAAATKPENPAKTGYLFDRWVKEDGSAYDFATPVTGNITLKATYVVGSLETFVVETEELMHNGYGGPIAYYDFEQGGNVKYSAWDNSDIDGYTSIFGNIKTTKGGATAEEHTAFTEANNVKIEDGMLKVIDTEENNTTYAYVKFGMPAVPQYTTLRIFATIKPEAESGKWSLLNIVDQSGNVLFALRSTADKKLILCNGDVDSDARGVSYKSGEAFSVLITIKGDNATLSIIQGTETKTVKTTEYLLSKINSQIPEVAQIGGVGLQTASGKRNTNLIEIAATMQIETSANYKEYSKVNIKNAYDKLVASGKYTTVIDKEEGTTNKDLLDAAYDAAIKLIDDYDLDLSDSESLQGFESLDLWAINKVENDDALALKPVKAEIIEMINEAFDEKNYTLEENRYFAENLYHAIDRIKNYEGAIGTDDEQEPTGIYAEAAEVIAELSEIATDSEIISEMKTQISKELLAQFPAENYTIDIDGFNEGDEGYHNMTAYETVIADFETALADGVITETQSAQDVVDALRQVFANTNDLLGQLRPDEVLVNYIRLDAQSAVNNYRTVDIAETDSASAAAIENYKTTACENILAASANSVHELVVSAKAHIDELIESAGQSLETLKAAAIERINAIIVDEGAEEEYKTVANGIIADAIDAVNALNEETKAQAVTIAANAEDTVELWGDIYQARLDLIAEAMQIKEELTSESYKARLDQIIEMVPQMLILWDGENGINSSTALQESVSGAKEVITACKAKDKAEIELAEYAEGIKAAMHNTTYEGKVDEALTAGCAAISNAGSNEVATALADAKSAIDDVQTELEAQSFTVTFKNGDEVFEELSVPYGQTAQATQTPVKDEERFVHWIIDGSDGEPVTEFTVYDDVTLLPVWEQADVTVNYYYGDTLNKTVRIFSTDTAGQTVTGIEKPADPLVSGKIFVGWYESDLENAAEFDFENYTLVKNATVNIFAKFTDKQISDYPENGTSILNTKDLSEESDLSTVTDEFNFFTMSTADSGVSYKELTDSVTINEITFDAYLMTSEIAKNTDNKATPFVINLKENVSALTVYFNFQKADGSVRRGTIYIAVNGAVKAEKTFGKNDDKNSYLSINEQLKIGDVVEVYAASGTDGGSNLMIYGVYATIDTTEITKPVTVKYYANEDEGTQPSITENFYGFTGDVKMTESKVSDANNRAFLNWYSYDENGDKVIYNKNGDNFPTTLNVSEFKVYAEWGDVSDLFIDFKDEKGNPLEVETYSQLSSEAVSYLPALEENPDGRFVGWFVYEDGEKTDKQIIKGETVLTKLAEGEVYDIRPVYTMYDLIITYYLDSEATVALGTVKFVKSEDTIAIDEPENSGYSFKNWVNKADDSAITDLSTLEGTVEIYADWNTSVSADIYPGDISRSSNSTLDITDDKDLITVTSVLKFVANTDGKNGLTANENVASNTALKDNSGNQFTTVGVTSDSCKGDTKAVFTVTAKKAVKVTIYLNGSDSKYASAKAATITHSKDSEFSLNVGDDLNKVYVIELTLTAEEACTISMTTGSGVTGYLAVFAIHVETI